MIRQMEAHQEELGDSWRSMSPEVLLERLKYNVHVLEHELEEGRDITRRCAHIGNFAAMIVAQNK
jgi:hypothetical protein